MAFSGWSQTAGSNTSVGGVSIAEGMSPGGVNNAIRGLMAEVAIWRDLVGGKVVSGGTADVQTVTTGMSMAAYAQGILMAFEAGAGLTNTGAMTINVDAIGAKSVKLTTGANPAAGAVTAGGIYLIAYEATSDTLLLLNPSVVTPASHVHAASDITSGTLVHERGGLEADVSAYAGFVKITGGATSAVAVSANGESLITAANYAAMRGLLDLEAGTDFLSPSAIAAAYQAVDEALTSLAGVSWVQGDLFYWSGTDTAARLPKNTNATRYLSNQGTDNNPGWYFVNLTNGVTGVLPAGNLPDASTTAEGIVEIAVASEYRTGTDTTRALGVAEVWSAGAEVTLTDAATIAVDFATFINAVVTLGGNRALGNPTNEKVGQSGYIRIVQDGTGSRTLSYDSDWEFAGGSAPVLSTTAGDEDVLFYQVLATNRVLATLVKDIS